MATPLLSRALPPALFKAALLDLPKPCFVAPQDEPRHVTTLQVCCAFPPLERVKGLVARLMTLDNCAILRGYCGSVGALRTKLPPATQEALLTCFFHVLFLMVGCEGDKEVVLERCTDLLQMHVWDELVNTERARWFLGLFFDDLFFHWHRHKEKVSLELKYLVREVLTLDIEWREGLVSDLGKHLGPLPSYLPPRTQR